MLIIMLMCIMSVLGYAQTTWQANPTVKKEATAKPKYQCMGTTAKGLRCKRTVPIANGYCYQHKQQAK